MTTELEIKKKILSYLLPNQWLFDSDYFDNASHVILWVSVNRIKEEVNNIKKRIQSYGLAKYFVIKQLETRKIGTNYEAMFFGFSKVGLKNINEIYAICKLRGIE